MSFDQYIFNQGNILKKQEVDADIIEKYRIILPKRILDLWDEYGFSGLSGGLFWLVNPDDFDFFSDDWRKTNDILSLDDKKLFLVARSAFGDLLFYVIKNDGNQYFSLLDINYNEYEVLGGNDIDFFFDVLLNDETFSEIHFSESLFKQCLTKLGALKTDECYGFSPIPVLGGDKSIEYAEKVKMNEYLSICAQAQI